MSTTPLKIGFQHFIPIPPISPKVSVKSLELCAPLTGWTFKITQDSNAVPDSFSVALGSGLQSPIRGSNTTGPHKKH
ncbi:hypothetical protein TNCV_4465441 [Trichonephila clavipes]|nr:hypothetical protein TNCV_4465441 [Trichonephila clavipes]